VLIALVAAIDFRATVDDLREVPPPCEPPSNPCETERILELDERRAEAAEIEDEYRDRAWLYALGAIFVGVAGGFARTSPGRRRELFTDLGVVAVTWLLAGLVLTTGNVGRRCRRPGRARLPSRSRAACRGRRRRLAQRVADVQPLPRKEPRGGAPVRITGFGLTAVVMLAVGPFSALIAALASGLCLD
jgi:hypothetical protein